jgi:intracellular sulfur oxidation DsrE/DsrF family protein
MHKINTKQPSASSSERRSFLTRFNAGAASIAALAIGGMARAQTRAATLIRFEPARHDQDDWMDQVPGKHRMVFDTISAAGFGDALLFANNFMVANRNDYGLQNSDLAIIVIARHISTGLGYNDAMWSKYGAQIGPMSGLDTVPKTNPRNAGGGGVEGLAKLGVQFAVCGMATRRIADSIARATGGNADMINSELIANLVTNGRIVPAGIVAVNRAQERGYSLVTP